MANLKFDHPKKIKHYKYSCVRCFFSISDDEQKMKDHCLKVHGDTGNFKKSYNISRTY